MINKTNNISRAYNIKYILWGILLLLSLTSCSSTRSEKSMKLIDKSVDSIQKQVIGVEKTTNNIKNEIINIKQTQPICNIDTIEQEMELLDIQITSIDNSLSNLKGQVEVVNDVVKMEVKEYRSKYIQSRIINIILIVLIILLVLNKINIGGVFNTIKNCMDWIKRIFGFVINR